MLARIAPLRSCPSPPLTAALIDLQANYGSEKRYSGVLPATHFLCMLGWLGASIFGGVRMAQLLK